MNQRALGVSSFMLWLKFVLICIWLSFSFVSRCSHVWYRSQLFDCILLVFFRQWSTGHARSSKAWCSALISCFSNSSNWCISILAVHSVICSLSDLFTQWFVHSVICSLSDLFTQWFVHSVICSLSDLFTQWFVHSVICSLSDLLPRRSAATQLSCYCVVWSWASTLLEFLFHYPCWCCQGEVLYELSLWPCACCNKGHDQ